MRTYGSLFSGGELAGMGAIAAGYTPIWGIEYDAAIADVARLNGFDTMTANILNCNPNDFIRPTLFHASPPCPNFSVAKQGGEETALDIALAEKVAEFITVLHPPTLTIENVQAYIKSKSYKIIMRAIENAGYMYDVQVLNAANFGVPQTRRRLFVRAVLGGMVPNLPAPVKWVGWYAAIADIIHTLPDSKFADWQLARLPDFCNGALFTPNKRGDDLMFAGAGDPALTVTSNRNQYNIKAFLVSDQTSGGAGEKLSMMADGEPSQTIRAYSNGGAMPRAFLLSGCGISDAQKIAFGEDEPAMTITASESKRPTRAWLECGRVVAMTPRALARFQSVPDSYILPERRTLAGRIIGNGVPSLMYQRIAEQYG